MASYLQWTDTEGTATFSNGLPAPGDRFNGWMPLTDVVGPEDEALGTGTLYVWAFREDYGARFRIDYIPTSAQGDVMRLIRHLKRGGTVAVYTGDILNRSYPTCQMWKGKPPELGDIDPKSMYRSLTLTLRNVADEPTDMIAVYG